MDRKANAQMESDTARGLTKREFLKLGGLGALSLLSIAASLGACGARKKPKNWAWLSEDRFPSRDAWGRMFDKMKRHGVDAALVLAKPDTIRTLVPVAREAGIELHNWIISLMCGDEDVRKNHPDWFVVNRLGVSCLEKPPYVPYYTFLCPSRPEVREYLAARVSELAEIDGLAGIHLDYIRYPDVILPVGIQPKYNLVQDREYPEFDYCYCPVCRQAFKSQAGVDPLSLEDPPGNADWVRYRYDSVTQLVNQLIPLAHGRGKMLTAAVFPSPTIARKLVRQDWPSWRLDAFHPMMYHEFYNEGVPWIGEVTREGVEALAGRAKLYSGLFVEWLPPEKLKRAFQLAMQNGAAGLCLFTACHMTDEQWTALKEAVREFRG